MAKYTINYSCGHGSYEEVLFGKTTDRERKIEWLEDNKVCTDCYKAKKQAEAKAETLTAEIICNPFSGGVYFAVTKGDTYSIKDALKAAGCRWSEYQPSGDILGMSRPKKAWMYKIMSQEEMANKPVEEQGQMIQAVMGKLHAAGVEQFTMNNSPLAQIGYQISGEMARKAVDHA